MKQASLDQLINRLEQELATAKAFKALTQTLGVTVATPTTNGNNGHSNGSGRNVPFGHNTQAILGVLRRNKEHGIGSITSGEIHATLKSNGTKLNPDTIRQTLSYLRVKGDIVSTRAAGKRAAHYSLA